jgi:hypothetical protein
MPTVSSGVALISGLPVLQSPAQLRAEYGPDLAEEIIANCGVQPFSLPGVRDQVRANASRGPMLLPSAACSART